MTLTLDRCANCNRETHDLGEGKLCHSCRPSEPVSTGAFHEGLREAMESRCRYCTTPVEAGIACCANPRCVARWERQQTIDILRESAADEARVIREHDRRPFDILVTAGAEFRVVRDMARAMELEGDEPVLTWFRDENRVIIGVKLVGHLSRETVRGMR